MPKGKKMAGSEFINKLLFYLKDRTWTKTSKILRDLGIEVNDKEINNCRNTLNYLMTNGSGVVRRGVGHFEWMIDESSHKPEKKDMNIPNLPVKKERNPWDDDDFLPTPANFMPVTRTEKPLPAPSSSQVGNEAVNNRIAALERTVGELKGETGTCVKGFATMTELVAKFVSEIEELKEEVGATKVIEIKQYKKPVVKMDGLVPDVFKRVLDLANCRKNILLVGPAGCGKTTIGEMISKALNLKFGAVVCTAGMSESHLLGKELQNISDGTSKFRGTDFVTCYEEGGVYLLDELDAADPNVLLCVNTALSNGYINLPSRPKKSRAEKHEDFICIATANTFGRGANRTYSGRNQLDESTIDRFRMGQVECDYDKRIERKLCPDEEILKHCWSIREGIEKHAMRRIMSTRFIADAYDMKMGAGWKIDDVNKAFFCGWSEEEKKKVILGGSTPVKSDYRDYPKY